MLLLRPPERRPVNRALKAIVILSLLLGVACGTRAEQTTTAAPRTVSESSPGAVSSAAGSCAEQYSRESLEKRDYAFDGIVTRIDKGSETDADRVTFDVEEWFKGGSGTAATRRASAFTATTSAGGSPHSVGQRLLVAGDEDFVWECGFTQTYSSAVAEEWRNAFKN